MSMVSFFKWLSGLSKLKFSYKNLFPSPSLSYAITKMQKRVLCGAKLTEGPEAPEDPYW